MCIIWWEDFQINGKGLTTKVNNYCCFLNLHEFITIQRLQYTAGRYVQNLPVEQNKQGFNIYIHTYIYVEALYKHYKVC